MFISDSELNRRLTSSPFNEELESGSHPEPEPPELSSESSQDGEDSTASSSNLIVVPHQFRGRKKGATQIPDFLRPIIGASNILSGNKATREAFNIGSTASPHSMSLGKTYPDGPVNVELKSKVETLVGKAQETAAEKLMSALGFITDEKLENTKAGDLARIAADMSRVIEKTTEKKEFSGAQIVIYAPTLKTEEKFEIIESN